MSVDEMLDKALLDTKIETEILDPIEIIAVAAKLTREEARRAIQAIASYQDAIKYLLGSEQNRRNGNEYPGDYGPETPEYWATKQRRNEFPLEDSLDLDTNYSKEIKQLFLEVVSNHVRKVLVAWSMKVNITVQIDMTYVIHKENAIEICNGCPKQLKCVSETLSTPEICLGYDGWGDSNDYYKGQHNHVGHRQRLNVTPERLTKEYLIAKRPGDTASMKIPIKGIIL